MKVTPPIPPARCHECGGVPHWRYRDRARWHCVACAPCPDPDDARFTWDAPDEATAGVEHDAPLRGHPVRWRGIS